MRRLALVLGLCATMLMPKAHATTYAPRVLPDSLGINAQFLTNVLIRTPMTSAQKIAQLDELSAKGIKVLRIIGYWRMVEPNAPVLGVHAYKWNAAQGASMDYDWIMENLALRGIRAAPLLAGTPQWDSTGAAFPAYEKYAPIHPQYYADFTKAFADRYGVGGSYWTTTFATAHPGVAPMPVKVYEIWNEENVAGTFTNPAGGMCPLHSVGPDQGPKVYADLYAAAYAGIKSEDSNSVVMVGGLSGHTSFSGTDNCTVQEFLAGMKAHRPTITIDAIGMHTYQPRLEDSTYPGGELAVGTLNTTVALRQAVDNLGWTVNIPLHLNENGWITSGPNSNANEAHWIVTDSYRGDALAGMADQLLRSNCNIRHYAPHTWITPENDPSSIHDWFGLSTFYSGGPTRQSAIKYSDAVKTLQGDGASAPTYSVTNLCTWRATPDIDGDGFNDNNDNYPADPTQH